VQEAKCTHHATTASPVPPSGRRVRFYFLSQK
jgi:hypothetical protein